jgi:hypothetical protein
MADRSGVLSHSHTEDGRSLGEIVQDILRDFQNMFRDEIRLVRAEFGEKAQQFGKAAGVLGAAAVCGLLAVACLVTTGIAALALAMPVWLAALLMAIFLLCIGATCYAAGRAKLRHVDPKPQQTVQTLKDDVEWAKQRMK